MKKIIKLLLLLSIVLLSEQSFAQNKVLSAHDIPTLAWYSIPAEESTLERYRELKNAGITLSYTHFKSLEDLKEALDLAKQVGVKIIGSCPELEKDTYETVMELKECSALAGYYLRDEPAPSDFRSLSDWVNRIEEVDSTRFCYVNLLPNYADMNQLGVENYKEYVDRFIKEVPVRLLTFDFYPIVGDTMRDRWYENLETISQAAAAAQIPFWAFALTTAHDPYPIPTIEQLRLQVYSDLVYGAKGIQYFTYWTPRSEIWNFHHGPITAEGKRTEVYELIQKMNEEIHQWSSVFTESKLISVQHTGKEIPVGTHRLTDLPSPFKELETGESGAILSQFKDRRYNYLTIVNRSFRKTLDIKLETDSTVERILKGDIAIPVSHFARELKIAPGDLMVFRWKL